MFAYSRLSKVGGVDALTLALNVHIDNLCEGCQYHSFPYEAPSILASDKVNGRRKMLLFDNKNKVMEIVLKLKNELEQSNKNEGKDFDIDSSISEYLPFFTCKNMFIDRYFQQDISMYVYCKDFNISPYQGSYGDQPSIWLQKYNIIKISMDKREKRLIQKAEMKKGIKNG